MKAFLLACTTRDDCHNKSKHTKILYQVVMIGLLPVTRKKWLVRMVLWLFGPHRWFCRLLDPVTIFLMTNRELRSETRPIGQRRKQIESRINRLSVDLPNHHRVVYNSFDFTESYPAGTCVCFVVLSNDVTLPFRSSSGFVVCFVDVEN